MSKRICVACGNEYEYCPHCSKDAGKPMWMFSFDKEVCKVVYQSIGNFTQGCITFEEFDAKLSQYDLGDFSMFTDDIKEVLEKIYLDNKKIEVKEVVKDKTEKEEEKETSVFKKTKKNRKSDI